MLDTLGAFERLDHGVAVLLGRIFIIIARRESESYAEQNNKYLL
jgi:hypothetical protein